MSGNSRILVVDDESDIRLIVGLNLQLLGAEVEEAGNGSEAIDKLEQRHFDGCVLDLAMPKSDGFSVLQKMASKNLLRDTAVVMLSAKGSPAAAIKALELGAHAHLTKPFSPAAVAQTVMELMAMTAEQREKR
jgi:CheY-like chemotaxis protein